MIAVTGATGFVGHSLCSELLRREYSVRRIVRSDNSLPGSKAGRSSQAIITNINGFTDWLSALSGVDCVIHCAAQTHVMNNSKENKILDYDSINVDGTRRLAEQAVEAGVRRLVFLSSIKVNGEQTYGTKSFSYDDLPAPEDGYGLSKMKAEEALINVAENSGLEVIIIRSPLIYGPHVKGNMYRLLSLVDRRVPLPFAAIENSRSLIGIDNLVDFIIRCVDHDQAADKIYLVSDGNDMSTTDLIIQISKAMNRRLFLYPVPVTVLRQLGRLFNKQQEIDRLVGSSKVDIAYAQNTLNWTPPVSVEAGILKMVNWYLSRS